MAAGRRHHAQIVIPKECRRRGRAAGLDLADVPLDCLSR
jgi:hypothetical protein